MSLALTEKVAQLYVCEKCVYSTAKTSDYKKHIKTKKHIGNIGNKMELSDDKHGNKKVATPCYECELCNRSYSERSGLWKHKQKCVENNQMVVRKEKYINNFANDNLIIELLKQNAELIKENSDFKHMMMKVIENGTNNTNILNNTTNSHNKAFNLNFFLNETCKNAMNITDFVDSIKLQLSDLIDVGELGFVEGISKIIVKNLNELDETVRPIHCTDKKRETFYVKDQGQWEKEDDNKTRIRNAIKRISNKNIRLLPQFKEQHPEYKNPYSKVSDTYDKMIIEVMSTDVGHEDKIIHNISKNVIIKNK